MVKERKYYFDYLRIICAFLVVGVHVCDGPWTRADVNGSWFLFLTIFLGACHCAVPVFFMISGALFLDNDKPLEMKTLYGKSILRMVIAFLFWSFIYALRKKPDGIMEFIVFLVKGNFHMWFIPALIGCYMIVPLLRKITESEMLTKYFLVLGVIFTVFYGTTLGLFREVSSLWISYPADQLATVLGSLKIKTVLSYPFYLVLGYYLSKTDFGKKSRWFLLGLGVLGYALMVGLTYGYSILDQKPCEEFYNRFSLPAFLMATGLFSFAKHYLSKMKFGEKTFSVVKALSKYTFGVYLVHIIVVEFIEKKLGFTAVSVNPIVAVPCIMISAFLGSMIISAIINKIPFINKYIV